MSSVVIEDYPSSPRFYTITNAKVCQIEGCPDAISVFKEGSILYEEIPTFKFPWYKWLWWKHKCDLGYIKINDKLIGKIRCKGLWYGHYLHQSIRACAPATALIIFKQEGHFSIMLIIDNLLQKYYTLPPDVLSEEIYHLSEGNIPVYQNGLSEDDIMRLPRECRNLNITDIEIRTIKILLLKPSVNYLEWAFYALLSMLSLALLVNIYRYNELSVPHSNNEHPLSKLIVPRKVQWGTIMSRLAEAECKSIALSGTQLIIVTHKPAQVLRILKKFDLTGEKEDHELVATEDKIIKVNLQI